MQVLQIPQFLSTNGTYVTNNGTTLQIITSDNVPQTVVFGGVHYAFQRIDAENRSIPCALFLWTDCCGKQHRGEIPFFGMNPRSFVLRIPTEGNTTDLVDGDWYLDKSVTF